MTVNAHIAVLAGKIAELITLPENATIVDATLGLGGHSKILGSQLSPAATLVGIDVDSNCIATAADNLKNLQCKVILKNDNFSNLQNILEEEGIKTVDFILADLGWCSAQILNPAKGMSFTQNQPLDMRLDPSIKTTASDIINDFSQEDLAELIFNYSQERASRRIAKFIVEFRQNQPIRTTGQLSFIVCKAMNRSPGQGKIHPATRTFQALRIAVNRELDVLEDLLSQAPALLASNGRIAVISFHSLEDRIVKQNFIKNASNSSYKIITKKPVTPDREEIALNPRARSAKLRIAQKL